MKKIGLSVGGLVLFAGVLSSGQAQTPTPPAAAPTPIVCQGSGAPAPVAAPAQGRGQAAGQGRGRGAAAATERAVNVTAIPGVVDAGAVFVEVYSTSGANADGVIALPDGNLLVNQEENSAVIKIDEHDRSSLYLANTSSGALSRDRAGRILAVQRMPTAGSIAAARPNAPTTAGVSMLVPERKMVADTFADGTKWTGRPNDLVGDGTGGAYFTQGCVYYASAGGTITLVAENVQANGIILNRTDRTLFVTNGRSILAFDVTGPGVLAGRRTFATPDAAAGTLDAMTVDAAGRLYVASTQGVQVFDEMGTHLGVIPTPWPVTGQVFAGTDRRTLYLVSNVAIDVTGVNNAGRTIYRLPMRASGLTERSK